MENGYACIIENLKFIRELRYNDIYVNNNVVNSIDDRYVQFLNYLIQKHKADWLEEIGTISKATKEAYWKHLNLNVNPIELNKGKDLYDFNEQEMVNIFKEIQKKSKSTKQSLSSSIS